MLKTETSPWRRSLSAGESADRISAYALLAAVLVVAAAIRLLFFSGLAGSDETTYSLRGLETARGLFAPSDNVGDLRYGVNLPIAGFVRLFGFNPVGLHAWAMLCSLGEVALVFAIANRLWGLSAAALSALLLATAPLHIHAGGRALADAPLAFFITLAFVSFFFAERDNRRWLYVLAGASVGFSWWIKPHAIVFGAVFMGYAVLRRQWKPVWWLAIASAIALILLEWAFFGVFFRDPLYAIHAVVSGIETNFVKQDAPWGDHAALFYFRQMFLDGRDMAAMPFLALFGLAMVLARPAQRALGQAGYVVLWGMGLLVVFSFLPYSFSPFKLIPKQSNYALMFFAPIALLGGWGISQVRPVAVRGLLLLVCFGLGLGLAALPQYEVRLRRATLDLTVDYAVSHPDITVFLPDQALNLMRVRALISGAQQLPPNVRRLQDFLAAKVTLPAQAPFVAFLHPRWPELVKAPSLPLAKKPGCVELVDMLPIAAPGLGQQVVEGLVALRATLPDMLGKQLNFAAQMHRWPELRVEGCGVGSSGLQSSQRIGTTGLPRQTYRQATR